MKCNPWVGGSIGRRGFPMLGTGKRGLSTYVKQLFSNNEQGFFYDPNDLSTMFQDAAGTTPVTAAGQPVGLILDKSKGLVLGPERIIGGNFESGLIGSIQEGNGSVSTWELNNTSPISGVSDGKLTVTTTATFRPMLIFTANAPKLAGSAYTVSFDYKVISGSPIVALVSAGGRSAVVNIPISGSGKFTYTYVSENTANTEIIYFSSASAYSLQVDNVSCKQVLGNHAYQTTSASRPILRKNAVTGANYLEFDGVDDHLILSPISLPIPFSHVMALEDKKLWGTQALFSGGGSGYLLFSGDSNLGVQQNSGNPSIGTARGNKEVITHIAANGEVTLKSNLSVATKADLVHINPYVGVIRKYIGAFNDTQFSTAARIDYYGGVFINTVMDNNLENAIRTHFNKRIGV